MHGPPAFYFFFLFKAWRIRAKLFSFLTFIYSSWGKLFRQLGMAFSLLVQERLQGSTFETRS